jgi:hypothetical protein
MASPTAEGLPGLLLVLCVVAVAAGLIVRSRLNHPIKVLALTALALRVVGSFAYYGLIQAVYGMGDYQIYYQYGLEYAERMGRLDLSMFTNSDEWWGGSWWSTQFVFFPTGMLIALLGPNILSGFVVFSLLAFLGLIGFGVAFHRSFPNVPVQRYLWWAWLFPSLWFWSAAIGKDALLLCGLGLAAWGFVGERGRINWLVTCAGVLLVFAVRPQVAAVAAFSMVLAQWAGTAEKWTTRNTVQSVVILLAGLVAIHYGMAAMGTGGIDPEGISDYMETRAATAVTGTTSVEAVGTGLAAIPMAIANILFRPFPFESASPTILLASAELWGLWAVAFVKRRNIVAALRDWRSNRLLTFALVFTLVYSAALGMLVVNLGIIARQRIVLFPLIFILFEARPVLQTTTKRTTRVMRGRRLARVRGHGATTAPPR